MADPDPLVTLWGMLGGPAGFHRVSWWRDGLERVSWVDVGDRERFLRLLGEGRELELSVVPRPKRGWGSAGPAWCLWCRTEGKASRRFLERFRPVPTLVLREGRTTRLLAFWALSKPLTWYWVVAANKRIAHRLRAPKKWAEPEMLFSPPGVVLRHGRCRPVPVVVAWHQPEALYTARTVVGRLKDPPDPLAWREAV